MIMSMVKNQISKSLWEIILYLEEKWWQIYHFIQKKIWNLMKLEQKRLWGDSNLNVYETIEWKRVF